jgi:hypothetical protein
MSRTVPVTQLPPEHDAGAMRWLGSCEMRWLLVLGYVAYDDSRVTAIPRRASGRVIVITHHQG